MLLSFGVSKAAFSQCFIAISQAETLSFLFELKAQKTIVKLSRL